MKINADSPWKKWFFHVCKLHFSFVFFTLWGLLTFFSLTECHVFSFTGIRALFVIMQIRKHAGNLIRAQIWFHMKDCLRGEGVGGYDGIILNDQIMLNVCFHNGPRTRSGFRGLRCVLVGGLKLTALQKVWLSLFPPEMMNGNRNYWGYYVPYQQNNKYACVHAFLWLLQFLIVLFSCWKPENGFFCNGAWTQRAALCCCQCQHR